MIKPEKKSPGLLAIALTSLLLLSSTSAASFINHNLLNPADLIVEPEIPNIPDNLRGHPHSHHHAHGHLYRLRRHRRAEVLASEMPFTFVHNTIELHQKRTPQTASDEKDTGNETEKDSKTDEKVVEEEKANQDDVVCEVGVVCPKGTYCTKTGCCPNGRECTGIETCLDYDDSRCPKNMACCSESHPKCVVQNGKGGCVSRPKVQTTSTNEHRSTTTKEITSTSTVEKKTTSTPSSTSAIMSSKTSSKTSSTTSSTTSRSESSLTTSTVETISTTEHVQTATEPPPLPTEASVQETLIVSDLIVPTTTLDAPTPSATSKSQEESTTTPIVSGAVAGSIVFIALAAVAVYTIIKKREERAAAKAEEELKSAPISSAAAPMGNGGRGRPTSIQPEPAEMVNMSNQSGFLFAGGANGQTLREGIPPPSPPPNAMVVGTPPYRREYGSGTQPSTPTRLQNALPQQPNWSPQSGYPPNFPLPDGPLPQQAADFSSSNTAYIAYTPPHAQYQQQQYQQQHNNQQYYQ